MQNITMYHFICCVSHVSIYLPAVFLLFQALNTTTLRGKIAVAHMFVLSILILVQNILSYDLWNIFSWIDILLQLHVMKKTCCAYVSFGDFVGAVRSIPNSLQFPPYDNDYVTEDLAETITPTFLLLSAAECLDLEEDPIADIPNPVHMGEDPNSVIIPPYYHNLPSHALQELDGDISDEDSIDLLLADFECMAVQESSFAHTYLPELVPGTLTTASYNSAVFTQ